MTPKEVDDVIQSEIDAQDQLMELELQKVRLSLERLELARQLNDQRPCRQKYTRVVRRRNPVEVWYECVYGGSDYDDGEGWKGDQDEPIKAVGHTPEEAERNFDELWLTGTYKGKQ